MTHIFEAEVFGAGRDIGKVSLKYLSNDLESPLLLFLSAAWHTARRAEHRETLNRVIMYR